jgi:hypothetical protein
MEKNRITALVTLFGLFISVMIFAVFLLFGKKDEADNPKTTPVTVTDSLKNLKADYDKNYFISEFDVKQRDSMNAQKILVFAVKDCTDKQAVEIAAFYIVYYNNWAETAKSSRLQLQMWFYTKRVPSDFNPAGQTAEEKRKYKKYLYGNVFYNYDTKKYKAVFYKEGS